MRYRIERSAMSVTVRLEGDLIEGMDRHLDALKAELGQAKAVVFDCDKVRHVNSPGVRFWLLFVGDVSKNAVLHFQNCPSLFVGYTLMLPSMIGGGKILSFRASFGCKSCNASMDPLIFSKDVVRGMLPHPKCPRCQDVMESDLNEGRDLDQLLG